VDLLEVHDSETWEPQILGGPTSMMVACEKPMTIDNCYESP
jgi:hypothetical protein